MVEVNHSYRTNSYKVKSMYRIYGNKNFWEVFLNYSVVDEYLNFLTDIQLWEAEIFVQLR
jgi:hypothetical protein